MAEVGGAAVLPETQLTLSFDAEGRIAGSDGCNRIIAGYEMTGEGLTIGPEIATTMMACPDAIMAQARTFTEALTQVYGFDIDETGALLLRGPEGVVITTLPRTD